AASSILHQKRILDVGCGGGILAFSLARLGAGVLGIDAGRENIEAASIHKEESHFNTQLDLSFQNILLEDLNVPLFDVVVCSEVLEHVDDPTHFVKELIKRLKPNGLLVLTTINRTAASFLFAKHAAE